MSSSGVVSTPWPASSSAVGRRQSSSHLPRRWRPVVAHGRGDVGVPDQGFHHRRPSSLANQRRRSRLLSPRVGPFRRRAWWARFFEKLDAARRFFERNLDPCRQFGSGGREPFVLQFGFHHGLFMSDAAGVSKNVAVAESEEVVELRYPVGQYIGLRFIAWSSATSR